MKYATLFTIILALCGTSAVQAAERGQLNQAEQRRNQLLQDIPKDKFFNGIIQGDVETVRRALGEVGITPNLIDAYGFKVPQASALYLACYYEHPEVVRLLLAHGADVNAQSHRRNIETALHVAARKGNRAIVELLLQYGVDKTIRNSGGLTPVQVAVDANHPELVELLMPGSQGPAAGPQQPRNAQAGPAQQDAPPSYEELEASGQIHRR